MSVALIVDDSRAMRTIISRIMSGLGFETLQAENGRVGLEQFEAHAHELSVAMIDWNMPEMNGLEMIQAIRAIPEYADHKLMMVTTEAEPARMAQALMAGVDEFVMKPFTDEIIEEKLKLIGVTMAAS